LPSPIVIHVLRPYASEEEYLARERSSIDSKSMLLIDQPALPLDTAVVFDVTLAGGQKPIRAEGRVIAFEPAGASGPGGLRVRFKRFGSATKAFIDRAVHGPAEPAPESPVLESPIAEAPGPAPEESSGVHRKAALPVAAPANREALLARLRGRRAS